MTNANKALEALRSTLLPVALLLSSGSIGCATVGADHGQARGRDMHVSATVAGGASRVIVSGPATLLHVDVNGASDLSLYRVARADGDACAATKRGPATELRRGASNRVNIDVASDEIVCVAAAAAAQGAASVTWHARRADEASRTAGRLLASNSRD
jgi:hypothetical protein